VFRAIPYLGSVSCSPPNSGQWLPSTQGPADRQVKERFTFAALLMFQWPSYFKTHSFPVTLL
jgi:hypothetical protein